MKNNEIINTNPIDWIKNIILMYYPIVDNRIYLMEYARKTSELCVNFIFEDSKTYIFFMNGVNELKTQTSDTCLHEGIISQTEIVNIFDFILFDHEVISDFNIYNNEIEFSFDINWCEKNLKGISCGKITISLDFNRKLGIKNDYIESLLLTYYKKLENTRVIAKMRNDYLEKKKQEYINSIDKESLLRLFKRMDIPTLKKMLYCLDSNLFFDIFSRETITKTKVKE